MSLFTESPSFRVVAATACVCAGLLLWQRSKMAAAGGGTGAAVASAATAAAAASSASATVGASAAKAAAQSAAANALKKVDEAELQGRYKIEESVGKGAFSEVFRVVETASKKVLAMKIVDKSKLRNGGESVLNEVEILSKLNHPNILKVLDTYETDAKLYIVIELLSGGELFDQIVDRGSYTEQDASALLKELLIGLKYLHDQGIVHRDIKPENLIFKLKAPAAPLVITDFGLARTLDPENPLNVPCGTPGYVAPEVLRRQNYNEKADVWSIGIIAYILLCGYPPFEGDDDRAVMDQTMKGHFEFDSPAWDPISTSAKNFISHLLKGDPAARYSASQALRHPWIIGKTASNIDLHKLVATNIKKNFARSMWKKALHTQTAIGRLQKLTSLGRPASPPQ